jgi:hypothetical protein
MTSVPLNIMCSWTWALPVMPGRSLIDPTLKYTWQTTRGTPGLGIIRIFMPLARTCSLTSRVTSAARTNAARTIAAATRAKTRFFISDTSWEWLGFSI